MNRGVHKRSTGLVALVVARIMQVRPGTRGWTSLGWRSGTTVQRVEISTSGTLLTVDRHTINYQLLPRFALLARVERDSTCASHVKNMIHVSLQ